ncbi:hypothetical protein Bca4012_070762 [Brassica carinata]|uniref:Uncharacterized protein n=1 Tax=Brassica carinata TaxID=52824 RepID=A0A8X7U8R5_BRACI|nr:hypothetical protein Bca52824_062996 [Brassica carinata]
MNHRCPFWTASMKAHFFLNLLDLLLSRPPHHNDHSLFEPDPDLISTVYNILPKNDLPSSLLPDAVTNFTLSDDGQLVVYLPKPCKIEFDYLVRYDKTVSGCISYGSITELEGIQVGFINKKLGIDQSKTMVAYGLCFDMLMGSIKERDEVSLSKNIIAIKGFVL